MKIREEPYRQVMNGILLVVFGTLVFCYGRGMHLTGFYYGKGHQRLVFLANVICYVLLFVVFAFYSSRIRFLLKNSYAQIIILSYCATVIPNVLSAYMLYGQPLMGVIRTFFWYGGWAFLLALILWGADVNLALRLVHVFVLLGVVAAILGCLVTLFPGLRFLITEEAISERFDLTRINILPQAVQFAFYFCLVSLCSLGLNKARAFKLIACLIVTFFSIFFINLSRQAIIATCIVLTYFTIKYLRKQMEMRYLLIILGVILAGLFSVGFFDIVEQSVSSAYERGGYGGYAYYVKSFNVRIEGIRFFWNQLRETNYIGTGKISTTHGDRNIILDVHEEDRINWTDIAIFGTLGMYGFPAILLVVIAYWKSFRDINLIRRYSSSLSMLTIAITIELFLLAGIIQWGMSPFYETAAYYYSFIFFVLSTFTARVLHEHKMDRYGQIERGK